MYKYRIDDETTKKVVSLANKSSDNDKINKLVDELSNYNKMYDYSDSVEYTPVTFEKMPDVEINEEKIKTQAKNELEDYRLSTIADIKDSTSKNIEELQSEKETSKQNYELAKNSAKEYYKEVRENASNDALKRGLSRSSIVINVLDAFNNEELEKYNELNNSLTNTINTIDSEITDLNIQQEKALKDFDITYAVKLQDKINDLTEDLLQRQNEVLKYNNQIAEKEEEYNRKYAELEAELKEANWDKEKDLMDYAGKYGVNMISKYKETQVYNKAQEYLDSVDRDTALYELRTNETLRSLLGENNISKLIAKYV